MAATPTDTHALAALVGTRVRRARAVRGMSLGALASAAAVGKGSLSEIERGARNPNLATLYALASALQMPLSALLADATGTEVAAPGIVARLLDVSRDGDATVEVFLLSLEPGTPHLSRPHGAGVAEQVIVTRGRVRAGLEGAQREAGVGESVTFAADAAHSYEAIGGPAAAINVIRTPPTSPAT